MRNIALRTKLLLLFLAVGVIPFAVMGISGLWTSSRALERQAYNQLISVRDIKKAQIEGFFSQR